MANVIRKQFQKEIRALTPLLHDAYRAIGKYQKKRNSRNQQGLLGLLDATGQELQFFKGFVHHAKQAYFDAILNEELSLLDLG